MKFKRLVKHILIIISLAIISGLCYNFLAKDTISLIYHPPEFKPGTQLTLEQAYNLYRQGRALFVDTRHKEEYKESHIKNALNLPFGSSIDEIWEFLGNISKEQLIVTYCSNPKCFNSRRLAGFLLNRNFENVFIFLEGFDAWIAHNLPVETYDKKNN